MEAHQKLKAIGITSGIGSLLVGARQAGFEVVGNLEWRSYYHHKDEMGRNTFSENFPGAVFKEHYEDLTHEEIQRMMGADVCMVHCECGHWSNLDNANKVKDRSRALDPADIPLTVDLMTRFKPRYFAMDNLPKSFDAYPIEKYAQHFPDYDLFPEWVSNWGYQNTQKGRNRMFLIGARKEERFTFVPGEVEHNLMVRDVLGDLGEPRRGTNIPNHEPHVTDTECYRALNMYEYRRRATWAEAAEYFRSKPCGHIFEYVRKDGSIVKRIGFVKGHWDKTSHVLQGGNPIMSPHRCDPLTIRERARIQGFPDDFIFYGAVLDEQGRWDHNENFSLVKQTGKAMPVEFAKYASQQFMSNIRGEPQKDRGTRVLRPSEYIDRAKYWYCKNVGYSDQDRACSACWLYDSCTIRTRLYGIGPEVERAIPSPVPGTPDEGRVQRPFSEGDRVTAAPPKAAKTPRPPRAVTSVPRGPAPSVRFRDLTAPGKDLF